MIKLKDVSKIYLMGNEKEIRLLLLLMMRMWQTRQNGKFESGTEK